MTDREELYRQRLQLIRACYGDLFDAEFVSREHAGICGCKEDFTDGTPFCQECGNVREAQ